MQWNWDHIRYFLALKEHGTLTLAAQSLGVSHTTVQRRVQQFESQLQSQLFEHTSYGYVLTEAGNVLYTEAEKMQATLSTISHKIAAADDRIAGDVTITTTDTLARYILPKLLARLSRVYPDVRFSMSMANRLNNIEDREADIAIRTSKVPPDNLIGRKVGEIRFCAAASREYVKKNRIKAFPKNVEEHSFVVLDKSYAAAAFYQWLETRLTPNTKRNIANNFTCAEALAREGMGITVLPSYIVENDTSLVELKTPRKITGNDLWVLSHSDLRDSKKVQVVRRFLYDELTKMFSG